MEKKPKELKEQYELFKLTISENLNRLKSLLNLSRLCFSFDEINSVQNFYKNNFANPQNIHLTLEDLNQMFYTYCGEAFIHYNGGNWDLSTLKKDEAYGTPIIINYGGEGYPWVRVSPFVWAVRIQRGTFRGLLSDVIKQI